MCSRWVDFSESIPRPLTFECTRLNVDGIAPISHPQGPTSAPVNTSPAAIPWTSGAVSQPSTTTATHSSTSTTTAGGHPTTKSAAATKTSTTMQLQLLPKLSRQLKRLPRRLKPIPGRLHMLSQLRHNYL
jgi:hypothetical protein